MPKAVRAISCLIIACDNKDLVSVHLIYRTVISSHECILSFLYSEAIRIVQLYGNVLHDKTNHNSDCAAYDTLWRDVAKLGVLTILPFFYQILCPVWEI